MCLRIDDGWFIVKIQCRLPWLMILWSHEFAGYWLIHSEQWLVSMYIKPTIVFQPAPYSIIVRCSRCRCLLCAKLCWSDIYNQVMYTALVCRELVMSWALKPMRDEIGHFEASKKEAMLAFRICRQVWM